MRSVLDEWVKNHPIKDDTAEKLFFVGEQHMRTGKHEDAMRCLSRAYALADSGESVPDEISLYDIAMLTGDASLKSHHLQEARAWYEKGLRLNPESAEACYGLGLCFHLAGLNGPARELYEAALSLKPGWQKALDRIAECAETT